MKMTVALAAFIIAWPAAASAEPSFIEAAIFFLHGVEKSTPQRCPPATCIPSLRFESDYKAWVQTRHPQNVLVIVDPEEPCTLYEIGPTPSHKLTHIYFDRLPHPNDFTIGPDWARAELLTDTHCSNPRRRGPDGSLRSFLALPRVAKLW
jgi:hypothetical protein